MRILRIIKYFIVGLSLFIFTSALSYGSNFSCSYGKQGACLDYGDKVCSSFAKCVNNNAVCFDSYACNYKGFICKSKFDDLADACEEISDKHDDLVNQYNGLLHKYRNLSDCISSASSLSEAHDCY